MILLATGISTLALIISGICFHRTGWKSGGAFVVIFFSALALVMSIVGGIMMMLDVVDGRYIDSKIAMYQNENEKIESDIDLIAQQYMEHEGQTFDKAKINSSTTLVQMYPDLKSSEIIQKQMDIYNQNNKKIKQLKLEAYKSKRAQFLLYFGGGR